MQVNKPLPPRPNSISTVRRTRGILASSLELPDPLARGLERFAELTRRVMVWEAAGWIATGLLATFTFIALVDRFILIEDSTRRFLAFIAYLGTLGLSFTLLRGALRPRQVAEVALALEERAPKDSVQERISTTVELASAPDTGAELSKAMVERVADEAAQCIQALNIEKLPDRSRMQRALRIGAALLGLVVLLCVPSKLHMRTAYCRAFFPWANLQRTGGTSIDVLTGSTRVVDGETIEIQIHTGGEPVTDAYLETRQRGARWQELHMEGDPTNSRFTLTLGPVHEQMEYRARAGDGRSAAYDIDVLPRPEIAGLKIVVKFPEYTHLPPQVFERLNGDISALKESHVELTLNTNTKLEAALLEFPDDRRVSMAVDTAGTGCGARVEFDVTQDTTYRVRLRSIDGVGNPDAPLFSIHALPDMPPQVTVLKPQSDECVDANSVVALEARGEDDYSIQSMRIVAQAEEQHEPIVIPLDRPADGGKVWMIAQPWDLASLALNGTQTITYRIEAVDSNGSIGKSDERRLRIAAGTRQQLNVLLTQLDETQKYLNSARNQLARAHHDVDDMRLVFRADDSDFQAADRLLLSETLNRIQREIHSAAAAVERGIPNSEAGALQTLLQSIQGSLTRFADASIRPLHRAALRAKSSEAPAIRAGLDSIADILPATENELTEIHEALTSAHRYAAATQLETRATEIQNTQTRILPILIGASAWTPKGTAFPGLLTEYFSGSGFQTLLRRTVEPSLAMNPKLLGTPGPEGASIRWTGQILAPKSGRYTFGAAEDGVRVQLDGKLVLDQWSAQISDDSDKTFVLAGEWSTAPAPGKSFKDGCRYTSAGTGARTATWSFTGLTPGRYRVSTTWFAYPNRATDAPYAIIDGNAVIATVRVNQQQTPADFTAEHIPWKDLGAPVRLTGSTLMVRLTDQANQYVIADAVRIERLETNAAARTDAAVELTEGWHDLVVELHRCDAHPALTLQSSGPGLSTAAIPAERLRSIANAAIPALDGRVRTEMGKSASTAAVKHALVRFQNMLDQSRALPLEFARIAAFVPKPDPQGTKEAGEWGKLLSTQILPLESVKAATPDAALPLLIWGDQSAGWVNNYKAVRERYRQAMLQFAAKLGANKYTVAAELRTLQREAAAAEKAFNDLLAASKQPADAKREMAMAKADATVRALAEDLRTQASEIAAELKEASTDVSKPIDERRALQALEARAEQLARGAAAEIERRLANASTPEDLAKTEQNRPNLATDTQAVQHAANELAAMAEREARAAHLRDELKQDAQALAAARDALTKPPSGDVAASQQHAASELKRENAELLDAAQAASGAINSQVTSQAAQLAQNPILAQAEDLLQKRAFETFSGEKPDAQKEAAGQTARAATAAELDKQAKIAREAAAAANKELGALAQAWNGDPQSPLNQAANEIQEASKALSQIPADQPIKGSDANLNNAATHAENAREKAEQTADRLALDAESLRNPGATPEQKAQADDLDRLASAIRHQTSEKLNPAADLLEGARHDPEQESRLPKVLTEQNKAAEADLRKLAQIAGEVLSGDANTRKQAHEKLEKELSADGLAEQVEQALKSANALDQMASKLANAGDKKPDVTAPANPTAPSPPGNPATPAEPNAAEKNAAAQSAKELEADRKALANALGLDAKAADAAEQQALAKRMGELAKDLRKEAERNRQMAEALDRAGGMEERAREKLKTEGAALAQEMQKAGNEAGQLSKTAAPLAGPLNEAQKSLDQNAQAVAAAVKQSEAEPLSKLAEQLDKAGQALEKPIAALANALGQPDDPNTQQAQKIGSEARDDAGRAADLAEELRRAERADQLARESNREDSGTREQLEKEVRNAIAALEKNGNANAEELAALRKSAEEGGGNESPKPGSEKSAQSGDSKSSEQAGSPKNDGQTGSPKSDGQAGAPKSDGSQGGNPQGKPNGENGQSNPSGQPQPSLETASRQARSSAEKMEQMAARMEKLANGMRDGSSSSEQAQTHDASAASASPMADAMRALAAAEAAQETGDTATANSLKQSAAELLDQAAEAARGQATGMQTAGSPEAQSVASKQSGEGGEQGEKGEGQGKEQSKSAKGNSKQKGDGKNQSGGLSSGNSGQKSDPNSPNPPGAKAPPVGPPPPGIPIDAATWNHLPDDLRRDLLNAAGGRFPAEYETSIRRYFKNVAAIQQDQPRQDRP